MITVVTKRSEIAKAQQTLESAIKKGSKQVKAHVGYQGGGGEELVHWRPDLGIWAYFGVAGEQYWCLYGVSNPVETSTPDITCEINAPLKGFNRRVAALYIRDEEDKVYLAHSGKIGGGRKGVGKQSFWENYRGGGANRVVYPDGREVDIVVIGAIGSPSLPSKLASFVREVDRIKGLAVGGESEQPDKLGEEMSFSPEFSGERAPYPLGGVVESESYHGLVVEALVRQLDRKKMSYGNDRARDLYVRNSSGTVTCLFEVKTDITTSSVYSAIGQLMFHGALAKKAPKRVAVLPGKPDKRTSETLEALGIEVVCYEMDGDEVCFSGLSDALAELKR